MRPERCYWGCPGGAPRAGGGRGGCGVEGEVLGHDCRGAAQLLEGMGESLA